MTASELPIDLIHKLPKTDLHCHLDGSVRLDTVLDLARKAHVKLPTFDRGELHKMIAAGDHITSLARGGSDERHDQTCASHPLPRPRRDALPIRGVGR